MHLPKTLKPYEKEIEQTLKPVIHMSLQKLGEPIHRHLSKVGGLPYWPVEKQYPTTPDGQPLYLLAQINLSEVPYASEILPQMGMLQFFLAEDNTYGMDFDDQTAQNLFRVVYHETTDAEVLTDFSFLEPIEEFPLPYNREYRIRYEVGEEPIGNTVYNFADLLDFNDEAIEEIYFDAFSGQGHKMGGYPFFTQEDPRDEDTPYDVLLLQLDSDLDMMWGDSGVANFFIRRDDLTRKDFSNVLYNWDCY